MDNHWVHGGRHPRRCWERFRRRSGQQPLRPYRTTGKSCSWPLLVLSLGLRAVRGPLSMLGCPLSSSATGTSVTKPSNQCGFPDLFLGRKTVPNLSDVIKQYQSDLSRRETGTFTCASIFV